MRRAILGLLAVAALSALAGCIKLDMGLTLGVDETVDGAIIVAFDSKAIGPFVDSDDLLAQVEKQNPLGRRPAHGSVTVEPYEADGKVGRRFVYTDVPLADLDASGALRIRHEGRRYLLDSVLDLTSRGDRRVDFGALTDTASASVQLTFPGEVLSANGEISGRSVTWQPKFGTKTRLRAVADDGRPVEVAAPKGTASAGSVWPWVALVVVGALALLGVGVWGVRAVRRRRQAPARAVAVPEPEPRNPTLPLPVLESPDSLIRDPRWAEPAHGDPWKSGQPDR